MGDNFMTPFTNPAFGPADPTSSSLGGTRGGFDLPDGKRETPDSLGTRPTTIDVPDGPAAGSQIDVPSIAEYNARR